MSDEPKEIRVPDANYPVVNRVLADPLDGGTEGLIWEINKAHPMFDGFTVIRMFVSEGQVEIYSTPSAGPAKMGLRHTVPMSRVRAVEEFLDPATFVAEIAELERGDEPSEPIANGHA